MPGRPSLQDRVLDCTDAETRVASLERAAAVVREGKVVVVPTDTVYGVGADAFDVVAVAMVLAAKHRGREMPPPATPDYRIRCRRARSADCLSRLRLHFASSSMVRRRLTTSFTGAARYSASSAVARGVRCHSG